MGPKMPSLGIFDPKCLVCVFLDHNFKRTIVKFEISNPQIRLFANFQEKTKMPKFGTKNA